MTGIGLCAIGAAVRATTAPPPEPPPQNIHAGLTARWQRALTVNARFCRLEFLTAARWRRLTATARLTRRLELDAVLNAEEE